MPLPANVSPMLATLGSMPAAEDRSAYGYEIKWDGYRVIARWDGRKLSLTSRNGNDLTAEFPELATFGKALPGPAILDGEIVAFDERGKPSFSQLQTRMPNRFRRGSRAPRTAATINFVAFDLLWLRKSLMPGSYVERREVLDGLGLKGPAWTTPPWTRDGEALWQVAKAQQLEGIIAKRLDGKYRPGQRAADWIKIKLVQREEFVIGGYLLREDPRQGLGALLVGYYPSTAEAAGGRLTFAGKIGTGFSDAERARLKAFLDDHPSTGSPFAAKTGHDRKAIWTVPTLVAEVAYSEWTHMGHVRHPSYKGLRADKSAPEVIMEPRG